MKVKVIKQFSQLSGILDIGDIIEIVLLYSIPDYTPLSNEPMISIAGYKFVSKNGETYNDKDLVNLIGYISMKDIFKKI